MGHRDDLNPTFHLVLCLSTQFLRVQVALTLRLVGKSVADLVNRMPWYDLRKNASPRLAMLGLGKSQGLRLCTRESVLSHPIAGQLGSADLSDHEIATCEQHEDDVLSSVL